MTTTLTDPRTSRRPSRRVVGLVVLVAAASVAALIAFSTWWTKPNVFDASGGYGFTPTPQTTATLEPFTATIQFPVEEAEVITIRDIEPRVLRNTIGARVTFSLCRVQGNGFMVSPGVAKQNCVTTIPLRAGQKVRIGPDLSIVMTVAPRKAGALDIDGATIAYRRGADHLWQTGRQRFATHIELRVRRS